MRHVDYSGVVILVVLALWMTYVRHDYWSGFMMGTILMFIGERIIDWAHDRWLLKRGYVRSHRRVK